ncbi:MAG: hypothetical protein JXQ77_06005 [Campylobacterales bacterium]|nr:hypothetical protein [Campylobacterales bacterium]
MIYTKLKKLTQKVFSSQTYILPLVNMQIPAEMGKIEDMEFDRDAKSIFLSLARGDEKATVKIAGYRLSYTATQAFLVFDAIKKTGYLKDIKMDFGAGNKIKIDPKYIQLVKKLI